MTNEEAFNKWWMKNYPTTAITSLWGIISRHTWEAAIAHMQEQSEPYIYEVIDRDDIYYTKEKPTYNGFYFAKPLFTSPQRVEASSTGVGTRQLKRLSDEQVGKIFEQETGFTIDGCTAGVIALNDFANAIMDEMERINK